MQVIEKIMEWTLIGLCVWGIYTAIEELVYIFI